jgi:hypothetical protein
MIRIEQADGRAFESRRLPTRMLEALTKENLTDRPLEALRHVLPGFLDSGTGCVGLFASFCGHYAALDATDW